MDSIEGQIGDYRLSRKSSDPEFDTYDVTTKQGIDRLLVTRAGVHAIKRDKRLLDMAFRDRPGTEFLIKDSWMGQSMRPGLRSIIYRNNLCSGPLGLQRTEVAIKQPEALYEETLDSTAVEQFMALEGLRYAGFLVVPVLLATENSGRLVTLWQNGLHPDLSVLEDRFKTFLNILNDAVSFLAGGKSWGTDWGRVDRQPRNYFVGNTDSDDVKEHFMVLDPISKRSLVVW